MAVAVTDPVDEMEVVEDNEDGREMTIVPMFEITISHWGGGERR